MYGLSGSGGVALSTGGAEAVGASETLGSGFNCVVVGAVGGVVVLAGHGIFSGGVLLADADAEAGADAEADVDTEGAIEAETERAGDKEDAAADDEFDDEGDRAAVWLHQSSTSLIACFFCWYSCFAQYARRCSL